jgi:hypothetical protein
MDRGNSASKICLSRGDYYRKARRWAGGVALMALLCTWTVPAAGEEYQPDDAGHPLRIAGYIVYPVGVIFDYLLLRPMYWVGSHEPFRTLFGREE